MHMQVLSTRLESNDKRQDQAKICVLKCPHDIEIRDRNRLNISEVAACTGYIADIQFSLTVLLFMFLHM
jgi:hypothetical protein